MNNQILNGFKILSKDRIWGDSDAVPNNLKKEGMNQNECYLQVSSKVYEPDAGVV